jgi:hypothetical protein
MKSRTLRWIIPLVVVILLVAVAMVRYRQPQGVNLVSPVEEAEVAQTLLAEKLSGSRYFNAVVGGTVEEGGPWIDVEDAVAQVSRISAERKLGREAAQKISLLIDELAEPHPFRAVGGTRINLLRLNLSLDSLEK